MKKLDTLIETRLGQLISVVLTVGFYGWFFRDAGLGLGVLLSMILHEIGHGKVLHISGVNTRITLIPVAGAIMRPIPQDKIKADALPWKVMALMLLAGPGVNIFLTILAVIASLIVDDLEIKKFLLLYAGFNNALALINLLPFGKLDGGQFVKVIFSSLEEGYEKIIVLVFSVISITTVAWLWRLGELNLAPVLFVAGLSYSSTKDNPEYHKSSQAIAEEESWMLMTIWMLLLLFCIWLNFLLPGWMELLRERLFMPMF